MALTSADEGTTWIVANSIGEGAGILPTGTTVTVTAVLTEPEPGVGGPFPAVLVTTQPPSDLRAVSFPMDNFEALFVASPSTEPADEPTPTA